MNDSPASSFALGFLAAGSTVDFATDVAMTITHGRRQSLIDVGGMLAENQALRSDNARLQANVEILKGDLDRFEAWGRGLAAELAVLKGR